MNDDFHADATHEQLDQSLDQLRRMPGMRPGDRVVAAMSGGLDSSVMAVLLHLAGFEVVGISMQLFNKAACGPAGAAAGKCCTLDDFQDARRIATQTGFAHYILDFEARFKTTVMDPFVQSYLHGETPSPCILCNKYLKFDGLVHAARELDAHYVATGHYARISHDEAGYHLLKSLDGVKDQSYFLFSHDQGTLARTLFPLESLSKQQVRSIARLLGLHVADKQESQEICFVTQRRYDEFIDAAGAAPMDSGGPIRWVEDGRVLGSHNGYWRYTVGQRKGLGVAHSRPLYVVRIDPGTQTVWAGEEKDLYVPCLDAQDVSWCCTVPNGPRTCSAKLRSRSQEVEAVIEPLGDRNVHVRFSSPQRAVTPGQAVVFYEGDEVLGGGWICSSM